MTVRAALTAGHVSDAIRLANAGGAALQEWADAREPGLRLRVRGHDAKWLFRYKSRTVTLGPASRWTVEKAREAASHVRGLIKSRIDPKPWIDARMAGADAAEAANVVLRRKGRERGEWTLAALMERYRDDHVRVGRVVHGIRRPPSVNTLKDVETLMGQKPYTDISSLLVRELDERTLETYRDKLLKAHGGSASRKGLAYVKAALSWARRHHSASAGLGGIGRWWLDVNSLHVEKKRQRAPTLEDIAMTIALAEAVAPRMPGRSISAGMHESTMYALWLLVFTSLRREAVVTVERGELIDDTRDNDGWGILYRPREVMKSRREHALPIPPAAMAMLRPLIDRKSNSRWLLPAARLARNGSETHLHGSAINKLLLRLRGMDDPKDGASVDFMTLAGVSVPDWSPHDVRRTFATLVEDWTTRGDAVSAVLDHEGTGADADSKGAAAITRTAYSQSQRLTLKRLAMEPWCSSIIHAVDAARPKAIAIVAMAFGA